MELFASICTGHRFWEFGFFGEIEFCILLHYLFMVKCLVKQWETGAWVFFCSGNGGGSANSFWSELPCAFILSICYITLISLVASGLVSFQGRCYPGHGWAVWITRRDTLLGDDLKEFKAVSSQFTCFDWTSNLHMPGHRFPCPEQLHGLRLHEIRAIF